MKTKTTKLTGIILTLVMLVTMLGMFSLTASAAEGTTIDLSTLTQDLNFYDNKTYSLDGGTTTQSYEGTITITGSTGYSVFFNGGTHDVIFNNVSIETTQTPVVVLYEAATLNLTVQGENLLKNTGGYNSIGWPGIFLRSGSALTVTAASTGKLTANGGYGGAGIGGDNAQHDNGACISILGGTVVATSKSSGAGIGGGGMVAWNGTIIISDANVTAMSHGDTNAAGIGCGGSAYNSNFTVSIKNSTVVASGSAGIGCGNSNNYMQTASISIENSNVTATGNFGTGIGGNKNGTFTAITIKNSTVTATSTWKNSAGIGSYGYDASTDEGTITIEDSTVTAVGGQDSAGIGGGFEVSNGPIVIERSNIFASGGARSIGAGSRGTTTAPKNANGDEVTLTTVTLDNVTNDIPVTKVEGATGYDAVNLKTIDGKLYLYLPSGDVPTKVVANGNEYVGTVTGGAGTFTFAHTCAIGENGTVADCNHAAICGTCLQYFGDKDQTNHNVDNASWMYENEKHYHACLNGCGTHFDEADCSGGEATCESGQICEVCKNEYREKLSHYYTYVANDETDTITESCNEGCGHSATITLKAPTDLAYDGNAKVATVEGEIIGTYDINYSDGNIDVGTHTATLTVGDVNVSVEFTIITPITITEDMITVNSTVYNGGAQTPNGDHVTVKVGGVELVYNTDYTIGVAAEDEFINAGTYTITIYGEGNYTGTVETTFTIEKATLTASDFVVTYPVDPTYDDADLSARVTHSLVGMGGVITKHYDAEGNLVSGAPVNAGTYTVRVDVEEGENYNAITDLQVGEFTVAPKALLDPDVHLSENKVYNGEVQIPTVTIERGLELGTDYTLSWDKEGFVNAGTYTLTVTGIGNYTGEITKTYEIFRKVLSYDSISIDFTEATYDGNAHKPTITVKDGEKILLLDTDYTAVWDKDGFVNAGIYTVTIEGKGNYYLNWVQLWLEIKKAELEIELISPIPSVLPGNQIALTLKANTDAVPVWDIMGGEHVSGTIIKIDDNLIIGQSEVIIVVRYGETDNYNDGSKAITLAVGMADFSGDIAELEADIAELNKLIAEGGDIDKINARLTEITNKLTTLEQNGATDAELQAAITDARTKITDAYTAAIQEAKDALYKAINDSTKNDAYELAKAVAGLETTIELAQTAAQNFATQADAALKQQLESAINAAQSYLINQISTLEDKITEEVGKLQNQINANDTDIEGINTSITTINGLIDALEAADEILGGQLADAIEKAEDELKAAQDELEKLIGDVQTNLDNAKEELDKAIADLDAAMKQGDVDLSAEISNLNIALANAKAVLEKADADNKAELVSKIETADATLDAAIKAVQKNLDDAQAALNKAIADGDTALGGRITDLNTALETAKAALEAADAANKTELEGKITEAQTTLQSAIDKVAKDLADAKTALEKAISDGDSALSDRISALSTAIDNAISAYKAADGALKTELVSKIETADATLDAAIKAVQKNLDDAKAELDKAIADGDAELDGKITNLNSALEAAKAALEKADAANKSELEGKITSAQTSLQAAIDQVQSNLDSAKAELDKAIADLDAAMQKGDADLSAEIANLNTALTNAKSALEKADADNKAELEGKITEAQTALQSAIDKVAKDLADAKAELNKAIADGDTALDGKITALNEALATARAALEAADTANKSELTTKIDEAYASLDAAVKEVQKNLDDLKAAVEAKDSELANKDAELENKDSELQTFIIILCVISGVTLCGSGAFIVWFFIDRKKRI